VEEEKHSRFLFALRGDRHPTSFPPRLHRSRSLPFSDHRFCQDSLCRAVQRPGMRAAVLPRLIVRGLGNFRRSGRCWLMVLERLSVVHSFRTVIVRVRANARMHVRTHPHLIRTERTRLPTCIRAHTSRRIVFQRADPLQRYLSAYLALEAVSPLPPCTRQRMYAITWIPYAK